MRRRLEIDDRAAAHAARLLADAENARARPRPRAIKQQILVVPISSAADQPLADAAQALFHRAAPVLVRDMATSGVLARDGLSGGR